MREVFLRVLVGKKYVKSLAFLLTFTLVIKPIEGKDVQTFGSPTAKVKVIAVLPLKAGCHDPTIEIFKILSKAEPNRLRIEIVEMYSEEGKRRMKRHNMKCATILINNKTTFTLYSDGKKRKVVLERMPNDPSSTYYSIDLVDIIDMELKAKYGEGIDRELINKLKARFRRTQQGRETEKVAEAEKPVAKVQVEVFAPSQQSPAAKIFFPARQKLDEIAKRYKDKVQVRYFTMLSPEAKKAVEEGRIKTPCILVNGKLKHKIKGEEIILEFDPHKLQLKFTPEQLERVISFYLERR